MQEKMADFIVSDITVNGYNGASKCFIDYSGD